MRAAAKLDPAEGISSRYRERQRQRHGRDGDDHRIQNIAAEGLLAEDR